MALSRADLDRFADEIAGRIGIALDLERGAAGVAAVAVDRMRATSCASLGEYFARVGPAEISALAERLTVGETYFFRYREQFEALADALPRLASSRPQRPLRILSAACSSGEEAGTLAIVARTALPSEAGRASTVLGVDVNPAAIRRATRGRYSAWSLRETPDALRSRWFRARGSEWELDPAVRTMLAFEERNLSRADEELWQPERYDVVFCRNALMYFGEEAAAAVVSRIVRSLAPEGLLFFGPTETHLGRTAGLALVRSHGTFFYERAPGKGASVAVPAAPREAPVAAASDVAPDRWAERIHDAAARIAALVGSRAPSSSTPPAPAQETRAAAPVDPGDLSQALQLLRDDRLAEALRAMPARCEGDPEALVLRGVLLAGTGDIKSAEDACRTVMSLDPLHAGARYLLALCREDCGDDAGAVECYRAASYLEPRFAMPHMRLGLLARRRGDLAEAGRELRVAAALLSEDDDPRLVLFSGGLRREALIDLCRAESRACATP
jgi:chemotaxis protein methyltransferase CheR